MTWFLFGQFGTPPLMAIISRRPMIHLEGAELTHTWTQPHQWWRAPVDEFKREVDWLHQKSDQILEIMTLPVMHVLAAGLNFAMILLTSRPAFNLPLKNVKEIMETRQVLGGSLQPKTGLQPKKVEP
jgi:hypothetical protein